MDIKEKTTNILTITREHLDSNGYYKGPDVTNFDGYIVLEANLGVVKFKTDLVASESILANDGTGIVSNRNIKAGKLLNAASIRAGMSINAGDDIVAYGDIHANMEIVSGAKIWASGDIVADWAIQAGSSIVASGDIIAGTDILADLGISAGRSIEAGRAIEARATIEAGLSIKSGGGIIAGLHIDCKTLTAEFPIFAGTATWTEPLKEHTQVRCEELCGDIAHGEPVLKGEQVA